MRRKWEGVKIKRDHIFQVTCLNVSKVHRTTSEPPHTHTIWNIVGKLYISCADGFFMLPAVFIILITPDYNIMCQ